VVSNDSKEMIQSGQMSMLKSGRPDQQSLK